MAEDLQTLSGLRHDRLENVISSVCPTVRARVDVVTGACVVVVVVVVVVVKLLPLCVFGWSVRVDTQQLIMQVQFDELTQTFCC